MRKRLEFTIAFALFASFFASCDQEANFPTASTSCPPGAAMISVSDGYLETLCGCAEPAPAYYANGDRLLCTVTAGTTVLFHYMGTRTWHQIVPTGTPSFPPSPLSNPDDQNAMIRVHTITLDTPGTYLFDDSFNTTLTGELVVL